MYVNEQLDSELKAIEIKNAVTEWYKKRALNFLTKRVERYSSYLNEVPKDIKIREIKLRWGSCIADGKLLFNWRIMKGRKEFTREF